MKGASMSPYTCIECDCHLTWDECDERICESCDSDDIDFDSEVESEFNPEEQKRLHTELKEKIRRCSVKPKDSNELKHTEYITNTHKLIAGLF